MVAKLDYTLMEPRAALSVDVEDYFHVAAFAGSIKPNQWDSLLPRVEQNTRRLLALCKEQRIRATFFVLGWVAERHPKLIREIREGGHEVACHGYSHRLIYDMTPEEFREDLRRAKKVIEDACGITVRGFRAPTYSIIPRTLWALDILIEEGFRYDSSIFPVLHDRYGIPGAPRFPHWIDRGNAGAIQEFPPTTLRLFGRNWPMAGGGYLRIFPFRFFKWAWRRIATNDLHPLLLYIHPWEVDPDQPRQACSPLTRWRHYRNLDKVAPRLQKLFTKYSFLPVGEILWEMQKTMPVYQLSSTPLAGLYAKPALSRSS